MSSREKCSDNHTACNDWEMMSKNETRIVIIGCTKTKSDVPAQAKDLYRSPLFAKRRRYADQSGSQWCIVSARWGLLDPCEEIAPYNTRIERVLHDTAEITLCGWRSFCNGWMRDTFGRRWPSPIALEVHAGAQYVRALREWLEEAARTCIWKIETPLDGLQIGEQLAWYNLPTDKR